MNKLILKAVFITFIIGLGCKKTPTSSTSTSATVAILDCNSVKFPNVLTIGVQVTNITITIPYTGGNGGAYSAFSVISTGVVGLTATANASNVTNGNGNLVLTINGTPTSTGTANFLVNFGGQSCSFTAIVNSLSSLATISTLNCSNSIINGTLVYGTNSTNILLSVPYTGGNGGAYSALSINSTGVTGLTATANIGNVANGSGNIVFTINGTPNNFGTAGFLISIGGQSCIVNLQVANKPINKSLFTDVWWSESNGVSVSCYQCWYFKSNGKYIERVLASKVDTWDWKWLNNSDTLILFRGVFGNDTTQRIIDVQPTKVYRQRIKAPNIGDVGVWVKL